jgi:hypothetical protein
MSKYESLAHPQSPKWMKWYLREDYTRHLLRSCADKIQLPLSQFNDSRLPSSDGTPRASSHSPSDVELDNFSNIGNPDTIADGLQEPSTSAAQPELRMYETEIQISRHEMEWSDEEALIRMRREERLEYM